MSLTVGFQRQLTDGQGTRVRRHRFRPKSAYKSIAAPSTNGCNHPSNLVALHTHFWCRLWVTERFTGSQP
jgi:hypothetical protein